MALAAAQIRNEQRQYEQRRSVASALSAGREAVAKLAESERLRAEAVAQLVEFDALDAHVTEGYATPQRHLIHRGRLADREARRLHAIVRFCANHPAVAEAMQSGRIGVDHADTLRLAASGVPSEILAEDLVDLLHAAEGVDLTVFVDRVTTWQWRRTPEATEEHVEAAFDERAITIQPDVFGGVSGRFRLDPAGAAVVLEALWTEPDSVDGVGPTRTLKQRRADQLVAIADASLDSPADEGGETSVPAGARRSGRSVDVVIDLPTLLGARFDLDDHRGTDGRVDWESIASGFARTGPAPRPVLEQFFCDASFRQLITSGPRIVLDYN